MSFLSPGHILFVAHVNTHLHAHTSGRGYFKKLVSLKSCVAERERQT